ncbi:GNAT family N-acetyltransferase [Geminicoccus roseus]|uniref:GNAT family N-acetyltransferase n=1 Tax=Geminicoccus roseus TaxID=404900 RepID=UPI0004297BF3|nr:GNAT family N-acetyltransferase [Geminicoccus roseus]
MSSNVIVSPYASEDAPACAEVFERAWNAGHPYAPRWIGLDAFKNAIMGRSVLVARTEQGRIVGFAGVEVPDSFIQHLYVDPGFARQGIGRKLLQAAVELAGGQATLKCQRKNAGALRFYRREGWTEGEEGGDGDERWVRMRSPRLDVP